MVLLSSNDAVTVSQFLDVANVFVLVRNFHLIFNTSYFIQFLSIPLHKRTKLAFLSLYPLGDKGGNNQTRVEDPQVGCNRAPHKQAGIKNWILASHVLWWFYFLIFIFNYWVIMDELLWLIAKEEIYESSSLFL